MAAAFTVLAVLAGVLILMSLLPLIRRPYWWARTFDFPRIQVAVLGLVVLTAMVWVALELDQLGGWRLGLILALGATVLHQARRVLPYSPLWRRQVIVAPNADSERSLRLVVSNVLFSNRSGERWLAEMRAADPDIILILEPDDWWAKTGEALRDAYPHGIDHPLGTGYGMCLYSRLPIRDLRVEHLVEENVPSFFGTLTLRDGSDVDFFFLHPRPPRPDLQQGSQLRDAELVRAARCVCESDRPVVVAGDLNDVAWSATTRLFKRLSGLLDPRVGRGLFASFHADHWWMRYPLDHVFHSPSFGLVEMRRLGYVGSDHFPVLVELALSDAAARAQSELASSEADEEAGREAELEADRFLEQESAEERQERREADV